MFPAIMHISFNTDHFDEMMHFYVEQLGCRAKSVVRWKSYQGRDDKPDFARLAETDPEGIFYVFLEVAEGQYIELFPA